jgi:molybdopterin-binding protein
MNDLDNSPSDADKWLPLPTYHWSEIGSPRYKALSSSLILEPVTITQNVHKANQTPKTTKAHAAFVIYDREFIKYKILEVVAPFVSEHLNFGGIEYSEIRSILTTDIVDNLVVLLADTLNSAVEIQAKTAQDCQDIGLEIGSDSSTILRSFKVKIARDYKLSQLSLPF